MPDPLSSRMLLLVGLVFLPLHPSHANTPPTIDTIRSELLQQHRKGTQFASLLKTWENHYGPGAVGPLFEIASDTHAEDTDRYIALMGAAKLGGIEVAPRTANFLKDKSWMLRAAALRILAAFPGLSKSYPATALQTLSLLHDPALIVRTEAVETVRKLNPKGTAQALGLALEQAENYHAGKALWVPQKSLDALVSLHAKEQAPKILPLLRHQKDPALQQRALRSLEALMDRKLSASLSLSLQAKLWESELARASVAR